MERLNSNCKDEQYAGPLKILAEAVHSGAKLGLEQTQKMLAVLNNPQDKCKSIQIAGTNGKGTCAVTLAAALQTQQKKVGLFTSPHLAHIRERFRINLGAISEEEFSYHFMNMYIKIKKELPDLSPSFFEWTTVFAFYYFAQRNCDFIVMEVGLGGRLDATNIMHANAAIITRVGMDHVNILGDTLEKITHEKCGIIKRGQVTISGKQESSASKIIEETVTKNNGKLYKSKDYFSCTVGLIDPVKEEQIIHVKSIGISTEILVKSRLLGSHIAENLETVLTTWFALQEAGLISKCSQFPFEVLQEIQWPARMQLHPSGLLIDAAHNLDGMKILAEYFKSLDAPVSLLYSSLYTKDWVAMLNLIGPFLHEVTLVPIAHHHCEDLNKIRKYLNKHFPNILVEQQPLNKEIIKRHVQKKNPTVAGSLYLAGDVLKLLDPAPVKLK